MGKIYWKENPGYINAKVDYRERSLMRDKEDDP